jgi:hypothetical protein
MPGDQRADSRLDILVVVRYLEAAIDYLRQHHGIELPRSKVLAHQVLARNPLEASAVESLAVDLHVAAFVLHCRQTFGDGALHSNLVDSVFANALGHANHTRVELAAALAAQAAQPQRALPDAEELLREH